MCQNERNILAHEVFDHRTVRPPGAIQAIPKPICSWHSRILEVRQWNLSKGLVQWTRPGASYGAFHWSHPIPLDCHFSPSTG